MLFVLAVCDVIIINVKDQINDPLNKMLEVCMSALSCMQHAKIPQPTLYFVQNKSSGDIYVVFPFLLSFHFKSRFEKKLDIPPEAVQTITSRLEQSELDKLTKDNFFTLPEAFNTRCMYTIVVNVY